MSNKEWLKEEINSESMVYSGNPNMDSYDYGRVSGLNYAFKLIDQLEEPEQEKVVIPQFVADFIEEIKPNFNIRAVFTLQNNKHEQGQKWALDNPDVFARAWLDGYSVEKKRKYVVEDNKVALLCKFDGKVMPVSETIQDGLHHESLDYELTETEIKDYDERYWAFAEEVME